MAKKLLSETIDFCLRRCAAPKIHRLVFKGESGDLCRLRALAKRDELRGVLGSRYLFVLLTFVPLPPFTSRPFPPLIIVVLLFPLLLKPPFALVPLPVLPPSGFTSLSSRRHLTFQFSLPLRPFPFPFNPLPLPLLLLNYLTN